MKPKLWSRRAGWLLLAGITALALHRLAFAFPHAVLDLAPWSAVNVAYRYDELTRWFAGDPIYRADFGRLTYPPATYVLLWPILGWLPLVSARVLYVAVTLGAAAAAALIIYRAAAGHPAQHRLLLVAVVAASYPLQASVFLGHVMPFIVVALCALAAVLLQRRPTGLVTDAAAALCVAVSLIKPTLAPPLVAAVLLSGSPWRWRPALLSVGVYAAFAIAASFAQPHDIVTLHAKWLRANSSHSVAHELDAALPNLHGWLAAAGLGSWGPLASLLVLAAFCVHVMRHRDADVWLLLGAGALIARLWSYHRPYDDAVLALAVLALVRLAGSREDASRSVAAILAVAASAALLTPAWALYDLEPAAIRVVYVVQTVLWIVLLAFLLVELRARAGPRAGPAG
jgi:hypothetical protein